MRRRLALFALGAAAGALAVAAGRALRPTPPSPAERATRAIVSLVKRHHPSGASLDETAIRAALARGEVVPGDPHSAVLSEEAARLLSEEEAALPYGGVGIVLEKAPDGLLALSVLEGSPAAAAGLAPGSRVVSIDGHAAARAPLALAARWLRGEPGTAVRVAFWEPGGAALRERVLTRARVDPGALAARAWDGDVVQVRLDRFAGDPAAALVTAVSRAAPDPAGIVLDLRDAGGGAVEAAVSIASLFLPEGAVVATIEGPRWGPSGRALIARGAPRFAGTPLVCLVNRRTASSAEILAGALAVHGRARLVGERTFGKGTVQERFPVPGGALVLTVGVYRLLDGRRIEGTGLDPDVPLGPGEDPVAAALAILAPRAAAR